MVLQPDGNRLPPETTPSQSQVPISRSRQAYFLHLLNQQRPPGPVLPETSTQNPCPETLESSFSRLAISHNNQPWHHLGSQGNLFDDSAIAGQSFLPFSTPQIGQNPYINERNTFPSMGFHDYGQHPTMPGFDIDFLDGFVPGSYQITPNVNEPVLNRNRLSRVGSRGFPQYGSMMMNGLVSKRQNSLRSSSFNNNSNNNSVNRRPHWLQEPLNYLSLEDLRGRIVALAKDQYGCKFLQRTLGTVTKNEIDMLFLEVINHVGELMVDPFGNYVVQKLVEVCSEEQRTQILLMVTQIEFQLVSICLDMHGTRAVQKILNHITNPQQVSIVMSALSPGAVVLAKDMNGHHVIQHCLNHFSAEDNKYLLNEVAKNCLGIATDKSGCCVLQQCVEFSNGETRDRLVAEIIANALLLSEDRFGNYVVQHILGLKVPQITENLLAQLEGSYTALSFSKFGSNVVEKCLAELREEQSTRIILELLSNPNVSMLLVDPYGNYVIQTALSVSKGEVHRGLLILIHMNAPMMRSNMYGKKVLTSIDKMRKMLNTSTKMRGCSN